MPRLELKQSEAKLPYLISDPEKPKKRRAKKKALLMQLAGQNESNAAKVRKFTHSSPGRPPLEDMYVNLHQGIVELVTAGAEVDRRRCTDVLNACKTLDDLRAGLLKEDYILSWQASYLCLIPRRIDNMEGKQHVRTLPVKLRKAYNNLRNWYKNANFTFPTKQFLQDIEDSFFKTFKTVSL